MHWPSSSSESCPHGARDDDDGLPAATTRFYKALAEPGAPCVPALGISGLRVIGATPIAPAHHRRSEMPSAPSARVTGD